MFSSHDRAEAIANFSEFELFSNARILVNIAFLTEDILWYWGEIWCKIKKWRRVFEMMKDWSDVRAPCFPLSASLQPCPWSFQPLLLPATHIPIMEVLYRTHDSRCRVQSLQGQEGEASRVRTRSALRSKSPRLRSALHLSAFLDFCMCIMYLD